MTPGIYKAEWGPGHQVVGNGVLVFMHNVITGADFMVLGCLFDGEYAYNNKAQIDVRRLDLRVPAGVSMAQGIPPQLAPYTIKIPSFVVDLDENKPTEFVIPTAPMRLNVRLTRLRRLDP